MATPTSGGWCCSRWCLPAWLGWPLRVFQPRADQAGTHTLPPALGPLTRAAHPVMHMLGRYIRSRLARRWRRHLLILRRPESTRVGRSLRACLGNTPRHRLGWTSQACGSNVSAVGGGNRAHQVGVCRKEEHPGCGLGAEQNVVAYGDIHTVSGHIKAVYSVDARRPRLKRLLAASASLQKKTVTSCWTATVQTRGPPGGLRQKSINPLLGDLTDLFVDAGSQSHADDDTDLHNRQLHAIERLPREQVRAPLRGPPSYRTHT